MKNDLDGFIEWIKTEEYTNKANECISEENVVKIFIVYFPNFKAGPVILLLQVPSIIYEIFLWNVAPAMEEKQRMVMWLGTLIII